MRDAKGEKDVLHAEISVVFFVKYFMKNNFCKIPNPICI